jgi:HD-GYP domain-containing protein (c-di-GMP phosphodiesterase class II)
MMTENHDLHEGISRVVAQLTAAVTNVGLYSFTHPQVSQYVDKAHAFLSDLLRVRPEATVLMVGDDLIAENRPLPQDSAFTANFVRVLRRKAVERLTFVAGLPRKELEELIRDLASPGAPVRSTAFVKLGKVELRVRQAEEKSSPVEAPPEVMQELLALTANQLEDLKDLYLRIRKHKQISVRSVDEVVKGFIAAFRQEVNPLNLLASIKAAHEYTFTHVVNVGILTMSQAEVLGFTGERLHQIGVASLLHDVGKLFVPEEILSKPGKLTDDERKIIETHTTKGARYLMGLEGIPKLAVLAALEHHLKYDGSGYPSIKGGWTPNIASQIISISDVFDAMRSRRSYQEPQPLEKIESVLKGGSGKAFNPKLVDHFLKLIKR